MKSVFFDSCFYLLNRASFRLTPPSIIMVSPWMNPAFPEARKRASSPISSGKPIRHTGIPDATSFSRKSAYAVIRSTAIYPGAIVFTRIPRGPASNASAPVIAWIAPLLAA